METTPRGQLDPIELVAAELGLEPEELQLYGRYAAKVELFALDRVADAPDGKPISVTADVRR